MKIKSLITCLIIFSSLWSIQPSFAANDLTSDFLNIHRLPKTLTADEQNRLQQYDIYFIPGILAESLINGDKRSKVHLDLILKDYFGTQIKFLNQKYRIPTKRILTSSHNVLETRTNILEAIAASASNNRKVYLISHSLGGLALLHTLISAPETYPHIAGIAFLQSPFYGSPVADLALNPPYGLNKIIHPLLPYINISHDTLEFITPRAREKYMEDHSEAISRLIDQLPLFTLSSSSEPNKSLFKPIIEIMESGCVKGLLNRCLTDTFFKGPYDKSDGLIPLKTSVIKGADYITLNDLDHAAPILEVPFEDFDKEQFTVAILRLLLKISQP